MSIKQYIAGAFIVLIALIAYFLIKSYFTLANSRQDYLLFTYILYALGFLFLAYVIISKNKKR